MIATKNRLEELKRTLAHVFDMIPAPDEVLVTADGCDDGTVEFLKLEYPVVRLTVNPISMGSVFSRAAMMDQAQSDLILALDDDSYPEQTDCIERLKRLFNDNRRLAIATFPQRTDEYPNSLQQTDFGVLRPIRSFPNSGACLRVSIYRKLPGFEPMFFHMYEEPDYALQCIANEWDVMFVPDITVRHHWTSNQRSELRNHQRHARNEFWSTVIRCPFPQLLFFCSFRAFRQMTFSLRYGGIFWMVKEPVWWAQALLGLPHVMGRRRPVSWEGYKKWLKTVD